MLCWITVTLFYSGMLSLATLLIRVGIYHFYNFNSGETQLVFASSYILLGLSGKLGCWFEPGQRTDVHLHRRHHEKNQRPRVHRQWGTLPFAVTTINLVFFSFTVGPSLLLVPRLPVFRGEQYLGRKVFRDQLHRHEQPSIPLLDQLLTQHVSYFDIAPLTLESVSRCWNESSVFSFF